MAGVEMAYPKLQFELALCNVEMGDHGPRASTVGTYLSTSIPACSLSQALVPLRDQRWFSSTHRPTVALEEPHLPDFEVLPSLI